MNIARMIECSHGQSRGCAVIFAAASTLWAQPPSEAQVATSSKKVLNLEAPDLQPQASTSCCCLVTCRAPMVRTPCRPRPAAHSRT